MAASDLNTPAVLLSFSFLVFAVIALMFGFVPDMMMVCRCVGVVVVNVLPVVLGAM